MQTAALISLALALAPALAIPPESFDFPSAPNDTALTVSYTLNGNTTVVQEAELFGSGVTTDQPTISVNTAGYQSLANYSGQYVVIVVDPDALYPQTPNLRFFLHWLAANMTQSSTVSPTGGRQLTNSSVNPVPYTPPAPPANSSAHRYIFYAFHQPDNFAIPPAFQTFNAENRTNFNLTSFIAEAKLGTPAAAMYMFVSTEKSVPQNFIALAGGTYPGGNGNAVTAGAGPAQTPTSTGGGGGSGGSSGGSGSGSASATGSGSSGIAAPVATAGLSGIVGAGLLGLAAML